VFNALASPPFPGNQCPANGFVYMSRASPFAQTKWDVISHANGITVNKTTQTVESATTGATIRHEEPHNPALLFRSLVGGTL